MNRYLKSTSCVHKTSTCQNRPFIMAAGLICHLQIVLFMMTEAAGMATRALTIQSRPLCIHTSWTSSTPSVFSPSHIWMWVSASGRFFSLPWGTAHPEGPIRRERTERDREQRGTLSSLATINNLADATSRVCRVTLCMKSTAAWLQLLLSAVEWIFTGLCCVLLWAPPLPSVRAVNVLFLRSFCLGCLDVWMRRGCSWQRAIHF